MQGVVRAEKRHNISRGNKKEAKKEKKSRIFDNTQSLIDILPPITPHPHPPDLHKLRQTAAGDICRFLPADNSCYRHNASFPSHE